MLYCYKFNINPPKHKQKQRFEDVPRHKALRLLKDADSYRSVNRKFGYSPNNTRIGKLICEYFGINNKGRTAYFKKRGFKTLEDKFNILVENIDKPYHVSAKELGISVRNVRQSYKKLGISKPRCGNGGRKSSIK